MKSTPVILMLVVATVGTLKLASSLPSSARVSRDLAIEDSWVSRAWTAYKQKFNKDYGPEEDATRREIFAGVLVTIMKHNVEHSLDLHSYTMGLNPMSDNTQDEWRSRSNGIRLPQKKFEDETDEYPYDSYYDTDE